jgi:hypothetical protein
MSGTGRRIILYTTTPKPTLRTVYTLKFKNKAADTKANHVSSFTAKAKKEHVELHFFFLYTFSWGVLRQREIYIFIKKK